jgi:tyrosinase
MVDKIWSDWQHLSPQNANSFFGGSLQRASSLQDYEQFPNGGPPFLGVSACNPTLPYGAHLDYFS